MLDLSRAGVSISLDVFLAEWDVLVPGSFWDSALAWRLSACRAPDEGWGSPGLGASGLRAPGSGGVNASAYALFVVERLDGVAPGESAASGGDRTDWRK